MREERFIGNKKKLKEFQNMLADPYGEQRIMFIWGPGGMGKTWLVQEMLKLARQNGQNFLVLPRLVDLYSTGSQHIEGVMDAIVERLKSQVSDGVFASYDWACQDLQNVRHLEGYSIEGLEIKLEALQTAFRDCLSGLVTKTPVVLALDTFEHVHSTPVEAWAMSDTGLQMPGLLCIIAGRTPNPLNPAHPQLGGLTDEDAWALFDSYTNSVHERTPEHQTFIRKLNEKAGRNPLLLSLAFSWLDYDAISNDELELIPQTEFERNIVSWFNPSRGAGSLYSGAGEIGEAIGQTLILMAYLNRRFNRYFLDKLVKEKFVLGADTEAIWAEIQHNLYESREFFFVKERPEGEIQLHDKLAEMLRVHALPDVFDDLTGERLQQFADRVVDWYDDLIEQTAEDSAKNNYRAEQLAYALRLDVLNDLQQPSIEQTAEGQRLKRLLPPDFVETKVLLRNAQRLRSDILNRLILSQIRPTAVAKLPPSERYEICTALGPIALQTRNLLRARDFWKQSVEIAKNHGDPEQQIQSLLGLFYGTWPEDLPGALEILNQALDITRKKVGSFYPTISYWIGITYRRMQDLEKAIKWYDEALKMARQYEDKTITPTILNDMGYALLLTGEYQRASVRIEMAARLREQNRDDLKEKIAITIKKIKSSTDDRKRRDLVIQKANLEEQLHDATLQLGTSYNTLGELLRYTGALDKATGYYSEALAIFKNLNSYYWQVQALHPRGDTHRRLSRNLFDQERHDSSQRYDDLAYKDISSALELCDTYGFVEIVGRVYRRMGRLMHDRFFKTDDLKMQEHWLNEASTYFEKCLEVALSRGEVLEEMETLVEIAFLGDDQARIYKRMNPDKFLSPDLRKEIEENYVSRLRQGIKEHQEDGQHIYHFGIFKNLLKMEDAALEYESGNYQTALTLYLESFTGLAQDPGYGSERCRRHFNHLFENIRRLPTVELRRKWCKQFMDRWQTSPMHRGEFTTLAEAHPDLFEQFELYLDIGFMFS